MSKQSPSSVKPLLLVAGLVLLLAIPVALMTLYVSGMVSGTEFSPDDFTRRNFSYVKLPVLGITMRGIEYDDATSETEQSLITDKLVAKEKNAIKTWHLCSDSGTPNSHECDARFLVGYFDFQEWDDQTVTSTPYWVNWNDKYPESAKLFWPVIADLARHEMYLGVPKIMSWAMTISSDQPDQFKKDLLQQAGDIWLELGRSDFQQGKFKRATKRLLRSKSLNDSDEVNGLLDFCRDNVENFDVISVEAAKSADRLLEKITADLTTDSREVSAEAVEKTDTVVPAEAEIE